MIPKLVSSRLVSLIVLIIYFFLSSFTPFWIQERWPVRRCWNSGPSSSSRRWLGPPLPFYWACTNAGPYLATCCPPPHWAAARDWPSRRQPKQKKTLQGTRTLVYNESCGVNHTIRYIDTIPLSTRRLLLLVFQPWRSLKVKNIV